MSPKLVSLLLFSLGTFSCNVRADTLVAPLGVSNVEGNSQNVLPFECWRGVRYQQVYDATIFSTVPGPALITQIAFRPDVLEGSGTGPFSYLLTNIQFSFSTTLAEPDALSPNLDSNVGSDSTLVFSGAWWLSTGYTGTGGAKDFDIVLNLQTPFQYDSRRGNLLMEVRNSSYLTLIRYIDAQYSPADAVSRRYVSESGPNADTLGLITRFTFTPVPEPTVPALLALGAATLLTARCRH